jgi:hypothetical protein
MTAQVSVRFCQDCFLLMNSFFVMVRMPDGSQAQLALASNLDSQFSWLNPKFKGRWALAPAMCQASCSFVCMPPPSADKQSNGNEEEQNAASHFGAFEHQNEQNDSDQHGSSCGQVMTAEVTKKLFDFIEVHIFGGSGTNVHFTSSNSPGCQVLSNQGCNGP